MAVSVVQTKNAIGAGSPTTLNFTSSVSVGNSVVVWIGDYNTTGSVITSSAPTYNGGSVTGATKLVEIQSVGTNVMYFVVWLLPNVQSSGTSVAVSTTNARADTNSHYYIAEVSGLGASPAKDAASPNPAIASSNGSANPSSGATGSAVASLGIALGGMMQDTANSGWTGPAGWTTIAGTPNSYCGASYQVFSSSGSNYTWSTTLGSGQWSAGAVILDATSAVSGSVQPRATVPVPRRTAARGTWGGAPGLANAHGGNGAVQPRAAVPVPRRYPARGQWRGPAAVATSNATGPHPAGTVQPLATRQPRRTASRSVARWTPVVTVNAAPGIPAGQQPHGFISSRRPVGGWWGGLFTPQANASGPSGTVQPRATVPVPRRYPARALWRGPAAVTTTNAVPPNPNGTVQPRATVPVPRRQASRGQWDGQSTPQPHLPGTVQPRATVPVPRRTATRAVTASVLGALNAHGPSGMVQPRATIPVPRRTDARGLTASALGPANAHGGNGQVQPAATRQPRRAAARACVRFTPVTTVNAAPAPPVSGTVQPAATAPHRPHAAQRVIWRGNAGSPPPSAPATPVTGGTVRRRTAARGQWRGPVPVTSNAHGPAVAPPKRRPDIPRRTTSRAVVAGTVTRTTDAGRVVLFTTGRAAQTWATGRAVQTWTAGRAENG